MTLSDFHPVVVSNQLLDQLPIGLGECPAIVVWFINGPREGKDRKKPFQAARDHLAQLQTNPPSRFETWTKPLIINWAKIFYIKAILVVMREEIDEEGLKEMLRYVALAYSLSQAGGSLSEVDPQTIVHIANQKIALWSDQVQRQANKVRDPRTVTKMVLEPCKAKATA